MIPDIGNGLRDWKTGWAGPATLLILASLWLLLIGTIFVYSSADGSEGGFPGAYSASHMKKILVGIFGLLLVSMVPPRRLENFSSLFYGGTLALLLLLLVWKGFEGGVVRWIRIGGFGLQPSELAKISTVMVIATALRPGKQLERWSDLFKITLMAVIPFALIASQPDLGTALILVPTVAAMLWVAGIEWKKLATLAMILIVLAGFSWPTMHNYQQQRILSYLGVGAVAVESAGGYQVAQSIIAMGSGGPTGKGLHLGSHHDLGYLPEDHNDFIFSVIGEEWGLVGTISVLIGTLVLILTMLGVAWNCRDPFGRLVSVGLAAQIGSQAAINQAMTVGLVPVTGLPLPLISYGGTSIVVTLLAIGIVISIARKPVEVVHPDGLQKGVSPVQHRSTRARISRQQA
ncbi:MAG: FtsW/RodA/SpoVE family cell cycle protein [Planctomycetota bacterium]|nr:FtsW/RodA/SpoVE family cell cycle protein [Planctomycetota bacterium]